MVFSLKLKKKQFSTLKFAQGHHLTYLIDYANLYCTYVKDPEKKLSCEYYIYPIINSLD